MSYKCEHGKDSDICVRCWEEKNLELKSMSEPINVEAKYPHSEPTPLQKAVEELQKLITFRRNLLLPDLNWMTITLSAAKQVEALQADNEALSSERDDLKERFPTTAQIMVYYSLLKKYKALQKENEELKNKFSDMIHLRDLAFNECDSLKLALKKCAEALKETGATIATAAKEQVKYPDHKRILFNGTDVTFKEMCDLTCDIANKALSDPLVKQLLESK